MRPLRIPPRISLRPHRHYSTASPQSLSTISTIDLPAPHSGLIRILTLSRPQARNAISRQLLHELRVNIDAIAAQYDHNDEEIPVHNATAATGPVRALVIASAVDGTFCAGADLKERAAFSPDECAISTCSYTMT